MVRRLFLPALLAGLLVALSAGTALGTIHPLTNSHCSAESAADTPAATQDPPGLTPWDPRYHSGQFGTPIFAVIEAGAAGKAFKSGVCPAQNG